MKSMSVVGRLAKITTKAGKELKDGTWQKGCYVIQIHIPKPMKSKQLEILDNFSERESITIALEEHQLEVE